MYMREIIYIYQVDSSPICKRHLESMLKGIKSYLCLVQTGHVDTEYIPIITLQSNIYFGFSLTPVLSIYWNESSFEKDMSCQFNL